MPDSYPVGQAPWETKAVEPQSYKVGEAPWEQEQKPDYTAMKEFVSGLTVVPTKVDKSASINNTLPGDIPIQEPKDPEQKPAEGILEAGEAGLQSSLAGLAIHGKRTLLMPEHSTTAMEVAYQIGQLVPDIIPMNVAGALTSIMGGVAGTMVAPGAGTAAGVVAGYGAGAMGIPTAIRSLLIDHYEKGQHRDWNDFWASLSAASIAGGKSAAVGALTFGAGSAAGKLFGPIAERYAAPVLKTAATTASEIATMVTAGAAVEGEVPAAKNFTTAGLTLAALHAFGMPSKLREIYKQTGLKPEQVTEHAENQPTVLQDVLSNNIEVPRAYEGAIDPNIEQQEKLDVEAKAAPEASAPGFPEEQMSISTKEPMLPEQPTPEPKEGEPSKYDEAVEHFNSKIGEKEKTPYSAKEKVQLAKEYAKGSFDNLYKNYIDKYDPIREAIKTLTKTKSVEAAADAYKLARGANDSPAKARHALEFATFNYKTLENNGESVKTILKDVVGDIKGAPEQLAQINKFDRFLAAKRSLQYEARGLKSGFDPELAREIVKQDGKEFEKHAKRVVDFQNRNLQYLKDSGVISDAAFKRMVKKGESYVPFKRIYDEINKSGGSRGSLKGVKGVENDETAANIQSPIKSIRDNTEFIFKMAEANRAKIALVEQAEGIKDQDVLTKAKVKKVPTNISADEINQKLSEHGIDEVKDGMTIFRPTKDLTDTQFEIYRDGKREVYEASPNLAEALKALDGSVPSQNIAIRTLSYGASALRLGTQLSPDFIAKNVFRDQLTAALYSKAQGKYGFGMTPVDSVMALRSMLKSDTTIKEMLKSGGAGGAWFDLNDKYLERDVYDLSKKTGMMATVTNGVKNPLHMLHVLGELSEQMTRVAEFKKVTGGNYSADSLVQGGFAAREVTVDFQRIGAKMAAFNSINAFFNAHVQGIDRFARAAHERPGELAARGLTITIPSMLNWFSNHNYDPNTGKFTIDPRYEELKQWERDLFWPIVTDNWGPVKQNDREDYLVNLPDYMKRQGPNGLEINRGVTYRIPKPQEGGVVMGTFVERMLDTMLTDNPRALKDFGDTIYQMVVPNVIPQIPLAAVEYTFNHNIFTNAPIIPQAAEKVAPEYRYGDYTSPVAKKLGAVMSHVPYLGKTNAASPAMIEHFIGSFAGATGKNILATLDIGGEALGAFGKNERPELTLNDIPVVRAFTTRNPNFSSQSIVDYRERYAKFEEVMSTLKFLDKQKRPEDEAKYEALHKNEIEIGKLKGVDEGLKDASAAMHEINTRKDISAHDKRQLIDGAIWQSITAAKQANKLLDQIEKQMENK